MFKINDQLNALIAVNGKELVMEGGNLFQSLWIRADTMYKLPLMVLRYVDMTDAAGTVGLQDNVPITVLLDGVISNERRFRVSTWTREPVGAGFAYTVNCYWDSPQYWTTTTNASMRGSSYEVLGKIAKDCNLEFFKGNARTADSMLWTGTNRSYAEFAYDIAQHGYVDDHSQMVLAVDTKGLMKYLNINAIDPPVLKLGQTALSTAERFVQVLDFVPKAVAGDNNMVGGYLHHRHTQTLENPEVCTTVTMTPDCRRPLLNKDVRSTIGRGGISYAPIDFGMNVHPKYERALYQNTRFNLLNNLKAEVLLGFQTDIDLFNNFEYVPPEQLSSGAYAGEYTVSGKIIYIPGASYYEKLLVTKNGLEV